jgi:hypothetical protein
MNLRLWEQRLRVLADSLPGAALGALVYGAWAVWSNYDAGPAMAYKIGAVHWLTSTLLTYFGTAWMRVFFSAGSTPFDGALLAGIGGLCMTYIVLIAVHTFIGTPHLLLTLAAGAIPNLLFCSGYALLLWRTAARAPELPDAKGA